LFDVAGCIHHNVFQADIRKINGLCAICGIITKRNSASTLRPHQRAGAGLSMSDVAANIPVNGLAAVIDSDIARVIIVNNKIAHDRNACRTIRVIIHKKSTRAVFMKLQVFIKRVGPIVQR